MTDLANSLIEKVRKFLEEKGFNLTIEWFKYLPNHEIHKWLGVYLKIFCTNSPPAIKHLKVIKEFFNEDDIDRLAMRMDEGEVNKLDEAFRSGLSSFFPTFEQWGKVESLKAEPGYVDYKKILTNKNNWEILKPDSGFQGFVKPPCKLPYTASGLLIECFMNSDYVPALDIDKAALEQAMNELPFINAYDDRISIEQHYVLQAEALIELYGFKDDICQIVTHLRTGENIEEEPTDRGNKDGRVKYTDEMKQEATKFYQEHKVLADKMSAKTWVEKDCIPHLAKKFEKEESYFSETTIRKDWLKLTS